MTSETAAGWPEPPRRTFVVSPSHRRFIDWCRERAYNPRSPNIVEISSADDVRRRMCGSGYEPFDLFFADDDRRSGAYARTVDAAAAEATHIRMVGGHP